MRMFKLYQRALVLLSAVLLTPSFSFSQNVDSLLAIVDTMSLSSEKGDMLLDVAWAYHDNEEPFQAYSFAEKSIDLFDDLDDEKGKAESMRNLAWLYTRNDEFITAEETFKEAAEILKSLDEKSLEADIYKNLGNMYNRYMPTTEQNLIKGRDFFDKAFEIRLESNDLENLSYDYFNLAQGYDVHSKVGKVLEYYYKAIEILKQEEFAPNGKNNSLAAAYANSGWTYQKAGELDLAIEYFKKALDHLPDDANKSNNSIMLTHLSTMYQEKGQSRKK